VAHPWHRSHARLLAVPTGVFIRTDIDRGIPMRWVSVLRLLLWCCKHTAIDSIACRQQRLVLACGCLCWALFVHSIMHEAARQDSYIRHYGQHWPNGMAWYGRSVCQMAWQFSGTMQVLSWYCAGAVVVLCRCCREMLMSLIAVVFTSKHMCSTYHDLFCMRAWLQDH
jgi:hypothetical protein